MQLWYNYDTTTIELQYNYYATRIQLQYDEMQIECRYNTKRVFVDVDGAQISLQPALLGCQHK